VPYETFRVRRAEILARFLARAQLYQTEHFGARLEWKARLNLAHAIAVLRSDTQAA
jgi:predicted metal-dependent HD superfamily phosphohydrolase